MFAVGISEQHKKTRSAGLTVWLDIKMGSLNTAAMEEGVKNCRCVVAIMSGGDGCADASTCACVATAAEWPGKCNAYFNRKFCVGELRWAREADVPIQPVMAAEDKTRVGVFLGQAPDDLKDLGATDFIHLDRSRIAYWEAGINEVRRAIEKLAAAPRIKRTQVDVHARTRIHICSSFDPHLLWPRSTSCSCGRGGE